MQRLASDFSLQFNKSTNMKLKNIVVIVLLIAQTTIMGQITITTSVTQNYNCDGVGCNYSGPSILINEVMLRPSSFDGSIYGDGPGFTANTNSGEWIELYNPDQCYPKDISGFLLGNNAPDNGGRLCRWICYSTKYNCPEPGILCN